MNLEFIIKNKIKGSVQRGFTLIELLVVISIIGILASIVTVSFISSQKQARDVNRKSDLAQYRNSLETYANKTNGMYPIHATLAYPSTDLCSDLDLGTTCPDDPKKGVDENYFYSYITDATGTKYVLWSKLENVSSTTYWVVCSNGKSGTTTSTPTVCPL